MNKTTFKPTFTVKNTEEAKNVAKMSVNAEVLAGHHQNVAQKHKYQVSV